jgi:hypothetical protein
VKCLVCEIKLRSSNRRIDSRRVLALAGPGDIRYGLCIECFPFWEPASQMLVMPFWDVANACASCGMIRDPLWCVAPANGDTMYRVCSTCRYGRVEEAITTARAAKQLAEDAEASA